MLKAAEGRQRVVRAQLSKVGDGFLPTDLEQTPSTSLVLAIRRSPRFRAVSLVVRERPSQYAPHPDLYTLHSWKRPLTRCWFLISRLLIRRVRKTRPSQTPSRLLTTMA